MLGSYEKTLLNHFINFIKIVQKKKKNLIYSTKILLDQPKNLFTIQSEKDLDESTKIFWFNNNILLLYGKLFYQLENIFWSV